MTDTPIDPKRFNRIINFLIGYLSKQELRETRLVYLLAIHIYKFEEDAKPNN